MKNETRRIKALAAALSVISLAAVLSSPARASSIELTVPSSISGAPGSTVTVDGTITNDQAFTIYLNSEDFTLSSPSLLGGDTTDFFLNAPLFLAGGGSSGLIPLFTFEIAPGTASGPYADNFLDILGGPGPLDQNLLASAEFNVNTVNTVPEPATFPLVGALLLFLGGFVVKRKNG